MLRSGSAAEMVAPPLTSPTPPGDSPARAGRPRPKASPSLGTPSRRGAGLRAMTASVANAGGASPRAAEPAARPAVLAFGEEEGDKGGAGQLKQQLQRSRSCATPLTPSSSERRDLSSVRVLVRVRPMSARERKAGEARSLVCDGDTISMGKRGFRFDNVLAEHSTQDSVFGELADQIDGFLSVRGSFHPPTDVNRALTALVYVLTGLQQHRAGVRSDRIGQDVH
eukprot:COSAG02_NODE_2668_length_8293_cov_23.094825_13_plen_225_part_00